MQAQWFRFPQKPILKDDKGNFLKNEDGTYKYGEEVPTRVQGALRPIEFWEYVFPEQSLQEVLAMQNIHKAFPLRPEVNNYAWILRKLMGAKKIPQAVIDAIKDKEPWQITDKSIPTQGMCVYPLGIRLDDTHDYIFETPQGKLGFYQEGL